MADESVSKPVLKWNEVIKRHGTFAGIRVSHGRVLSVLCGGSGHDDVVRSSCIYYSVPDRPHYRSSRNALRKSAREGTEFAVFQKVAKNEWLDLGPHRVSSIKQRDEDALFSLVRSGSDLPPDEAVEE